MGISALNAARVVSLVSITAILAGLYGFYWLVGKRSVAWLPLLFLAWFAPFREVIGFAWTEPLALAFLIWSLLTYLVHDRYPHWWLFPLSGFLAGMAAGTRFVIALLFVVYLVDLFVQRHPIKEIIKRSTLLFTAGAVTIVPTIIYNFISSGRFLPAQLPTEKTFWVNLTDVFTAIFTQVFYKLNLPFVIGLVLLLLIGWILIRRSGQSFRKNRSYQMALSPLAHLLVHGISRCPPDSTVNHFLQPVKFADSDHDHSLDDVGSLPIAGYPIPQETDLAERLLPSLVSGCDSQ